eukprot:893144-Amphidinium_carterae.1
MVSWRAGRLERVTASSLAAEAYSLMAGVAQGELQQHFSRPQSTVSMGKRIRDDSRRCGHWPQHLSHRLDQWCSHYRREVPL